MIHIRRIAHVVEISSFLCLNERLEGKLGEQGRQKIFTLKKNQLFIM